MRHDQVSLALQFNLNRIFSQKNSIIAFDRLEWQVLGFLMLGSPGFIARIITKRQWKARSNLDDIAALDVLLLLNPRWQK